MYKFWTKINKILLGISVIFGFILVGILTYKCAENNYTEQYSWIVFIIGIVVVLAVHALWGLFIEISNNLILLRIKLYGEIEEEENKSDESDEETPSYEGLEPWKCSCGYINAAEDVFCKKCGALIETPDDENEQQ